VPGLCIEYSGFFLTTEEKSWKTLSQGSRKALGKGKDNADDGDNVIRETCVLRS